MMLAVKNEMRLRTRKFRSETHKFGFPFALKSVLNDVGIKKRLYIKIPNIDKTFTVNHHTFWKRLENCDWEFNCINYLHDVIQEGQTIVDIGAWIGPYTLFFSQLVKKHGKVIAFDPDPVAFKILKENIKENNLSNVCIEKFLISNNNDKAFLISQDEFGDSESSIVLKPSIEEPKIEILVDSVTLDEYCKLHNIIPDGIKIDVEGAEKLVIEGCREIISKYNPWVLLEFHGNFMSETERRQNWNYIIKDSEKVIFIGGKYCKDCKYNIGDEVTSMPDCTYFHVFIQY